MRILLLPILSGLLYLAAIAVSAQKSDSDANDSAESQQAEVVVLTESNWEEFVPEGKEVDAIYGDIVLRNDFLTAVIARPVATRNANMTVRSVGGCLIDLTSNAYQSDQLSCFYAGGGQYAYTDWRVVIDGHEREPANRLSETGQKIAVKVTSPGSDDRPSVTTTYTLTADATSLTINTEAINSTKRTLTFNPVDRIRADGGKEEMTKSPNGTTPVHWIDDTYWQQAYAIRVAGDGEIQCNSDARTSTLKYLSAEGSDVVSVGPEDGTSFERTITPGRTLADAFLSQGESRRTVISVTDGFGDPISDAELEVNSNGIPMSVLRTDEEGVCQARFPLGEIEFQVKRFGEVLSEKQMIQVMTGEGDLQLNWQAKAYRPGELFLLVVDGDGEELPCKVEIVGQAGAATPDFGPESAEFAVKNLRYVQDGSCTQALSPGKYLIRVSHGTEYSAEEFEVEVQSGETTSQQIALYRTVNTEGWVSSDFHSHSTPSGDNTSSQLGRVLNLVCEHIEFAPCTEHNRIDSYEAHFRALGIQQRISSVTGMELTGSPLPLNHQNVFPLHHHPHRQDGGGPTTDSDVDIQVQRIAAWDDGSEKLIQQNHPDVGWLVYDKNGDGDYDDGHSSAVALLDVMEIHPIPRVMQTGKTSDLTAEEANSNRIFKWLQLLNQGRRIPGVVNTDAHYNFHGSGGMRNWIACSTDNPAEIDPMEIVRASEEGRVVMSNGPFLRFSAESGEKTVGIGQDLVAKNGEVELSVSVQCPNWFSVDTVFVLLNGRAREDLIFTAESHPDLFREEGQGGQKRQVFRRDIQLKLNADTHIIAVAGNSQSTLGPFMGPQWGAAPPAALTNPIFVDVDGGGFTANQDKLGRPLPVKGD